MVKTCCHRLMDQDEEDYIADGPIEGSVDYNIRSVRWLCGETLSIHRDWVVLCMSCARRNGFVW